MDVSHRVMGVTGVALVLVAMALLQGCGTGESAGGIFGAGLSLSADELSGVVLFASTRDFNSELYYYSPLAEDPVRITTLSSNESQPCFSPDGTRIAFVSDYDGDDEIYIMDAIGGGNVLQLTENTALDGRPRWSPDGSTIVYHSTVDNQWLELYTIPATGGEPTRLTTNDYPDSSPVFSPDGASIAWSARPVSGQPAEIWVMDLATRTPRSLTAATHSANNESALFPAYAPVDGNHPEDPVRIAYSVQPPDTNTDLWVMNADGTGAYRVTDTHGGATRPAWSADGQFIVFDMFSSGITTLYIVSAGGGAPAELLSKRQTEGSDTSPFFYPIP